MMLDPLETLPPSFQALVKSFKDKGNPTPHPIKEVPSFLDNSNSY